MSPATTHTHHCTVCRQAWLHGDEAGCAGIRWRCCTPCWQAQHAPEGPPHTTASLTCWCQPQVVPVNAVGGLAIWLILAAYKGLRTSVVEATPVRPPCVVLHREEAP